ncbi:MAG: FHA domain-containing protein [Lentisphaerae bacterium]|nr:FHA domain-containing protein [Lentisphaerota bacterium]
MECKLILIKSDSEETFIPRQGITSIGRDMDNDIQLVLESVSRHHAKLYNMGSACEIEDLDSSNGTFVNGSKITKASLKDGDDLSLGDCRMRFELTKSSAADTDASQSHEYSDRAMQETVKVRKYPAESNNAEAKRQTSSITPLKPLRSLKVKQ